jgi:DNA invertase Pin-like site-specific DNA recombinase
MRIIVYSRQTSGQCEAQVELLRKSIERRGDRVIAIVADDPKIIGRGKYTGWRAVVSELAQIDQIVVNSAGDLPGKSVADLLKILATLCDNGVSLILSQDGIDTGSGSASVLHLVAAYRVAKRSEAIRRGISRARIEGKVIGRPAVSEDIRRRVQDAIANGGGIRATARRFGVSAASVINIRDAMMINIEQEKLAA